jgi:hypothetical protein
MITCPVCEHQQAHGLECESCGKVLSVARPMRVAVTPMAELEGTELQGGRGEVHVQAIADLEGTKLRAGPDLPPMMVPDIDRTELQKVGEVPLEVVSGLDLGREEDDGQRTQLPTGAVTCRYCRNVQMEGAVCEKCGMRLPYNPAAVVVGVEEGAAAGPKKRKEAVWTRCKSCGAPAKGGEKCGDCGRDVPMPEP